MTTTSMEGIGRPPLTTVLEFLVEPTTEDPVDYRNWWALMLCVFPILSFLGNILVIVAVFTQRPLRTPTNFYIVSLGVADLLVAVSVMPFGVYYLFVGKWDLPPSWCDFYIFTDVTCSTASIFNLVAISIDRYLAVTRPIRYARHKNLNRVAIMITLAWGLSVFVGLPILLGFNNTPNRPRNECVFNSKLYVLYSSTISFGLPCLMMLYLYFCIFMAIRGRTRRPFGGRKSPPTARTGSDPDQPGDIAIKNIRQTRRRIAQDDRTTTNTASDEDLYPSALPGSSGDPSRSARFLMAAVVEETGLIMANLASPIPIGDPIETTTNIDSGYVASNMGVDNTDEITKDNKASPPHSPTKAVTHPKKRKLTVPRLNPLKTAAAKLAFYKAQRQNRQQLRSMARMERRATQTLLVVIGVFLGCWLPFFCFSLFDACNTVFKLGFQIKHSMTYFIITTWLGYINSFINPLIYTIFNLEFRKAFKKILHL